MQVDARRLGQAGIGDLADQDVLEPVGGLARDRRTRLRHDELAAQEHVERLADLLQLRGQLGDCAAPEDPADHGRPLQDGLLVRRQPIDPRSDQRLQGVRDPLREFRRRPALALVQHPDRLLEEERIPLGLREQRRPRLGIDGPVDRERVDELLALHSVERLELDRRRAQPAAAPTGTDVEQLGARESQDQERRVADPLREVLDQVEQRLFCPVDVLEGEHERRVAAEPIDPFARCPGDLLLAPLALDRLEHARGKAEQIGDLLALARLTELLDRDLQRVVVRDPRGGLDHLGERPVGDALAVRQRAAGEHRRALERLDELPREPALADARIAVDREQVRALVLDRAVIGVLEQLQLLVAADERRPDRLRRGVGPDVGGAPGPGPLSEAFQVDRPDVLRLEPPLGEAVGVRPEQ